MKKTSVGVGILSALTSVFAGTGCITGALAGSGKILTYFIPEAEAYIDSVNGISGKLLAIAAILLVAGIVIGVKLRRPYLPMLIGGGIGLIPVIMVIVALPVGKFRAVLTLILVLAALAVICRLLHGILKRNLTEGRMP